MPSDLPLEDAVVWLMFVTTLERTKSPTIMAAFHWFALFLILSTTIFVNAGRSKRSPILTNDLAKPNEFRHAVAIVDYTRTHHCSGGIIGERFILSAAHCFVNEEKELISDRFTVFAGTIDYKSAWTDRNATLVWVRKIFVPRDVDIALPRADIAVLELFDDLEIHRRNLAKLELPPKSLNVPFGQLTEVAAFGACNVTVHDNRVTAEEVDGKLRYAKIRIVDRPQCHENLCCMGIFSRILTKGNDKLLGQMEKISTQKFGMCKGDSGSTLVSNPRTVIGVTIKASGEVCDERTGPSIYTKVSYYVRFIENVMSGNYVKMLVGQCRT